MFQHLRLELVLSNMLSWTSPGVSQLFWWWCDMTETLRGSQMQGSHSTVLICRHWSFSIMLQCHRAHGQMFGSPQLAPPHRQLSPFLLLKSVFYALKRKTKAAQEILSYQSQSHSSKLRIINTNLVSFGFILGTIFKTRFIARADNQTVLQMSSKCHNQMWVISWVIWLPSEFFHQIVALLDWSFLPSISEPLSHNFVLTCYQSFLPSTDWEHIADDWPCQFCGASHVPLQNYSVKGAASPFWFSVTSAWDWNPDSSPHHEHILGHYTIWSRDHLLRTFECMPLPYHFSLSWASNSLPGQNNFLAASYIGHRAVFCQSGLPEKLKGMYIVGTFWLIFCILSFLLMFPFSLFFAESKVFNKLFVHLSLNS